MASHKLVFWRQNSGKRLFRYFSSNTQSNPFMCRTGGNRKQRLWAGRASNQSLTWVLNICMLLVCPRHIETIPSASNFRSSTKFNYSINVIKKTTRYSWYEIPGESSWPLECAYVVLRCRRWAWNNSQSNLPPTLSIAINYFWLFYISGKTMMNSNSATTKLGPRRGAMPYHYLRVWLYMGNRFNRGCLCGWPQNRLFSSNASVICSFYYCYSKGWLFMENE